MMKCHTDPESRPIHTDKTILIIEDDQHIREAMQFSLEVEGYHVCSAANGQEGLGIIQKMMNPCLVLLDLVMPVMNGIDFLTSLQKESLLRAIPVVVISAFPEKEKELKAKHLETRGFIQKPLDLEVLLGWAKRYCG